MTSGDRRLSRTQAEMARGAEIVMDLMNKQCVEIAKDALSAAFNPDHEPNPDVPNGSISAFERLQRDEYRGRLSQQNGGQNK